MALRVNVPHARGVTLGDNRAWPATTLCTGHSASATSRLLLAPPSPHHPCCLSHEAGQRSRACPVRSLRVMRTPSSCCVSVARDGCSSSRRGSRQGGRCPCPHTIDRHPCGSPSTPDSTA